MHRKELRAKRRRLAEEKAASGVLDAVATEDDQNADQQEVAEGFTGDMDAL